MPGPRGTAEHAEHAAEVVECADTMLELWNQIWADGECDPHDRRLLEPVILEQRRKAKRNEKEANQIDGVVSMAKQLLHTCQVTPKVQRTMREKIADEQYLLEAA